MKSDKIMINEVRYQAQSRIAKDVWCEPVQEKYAAGLEEMNMGSNNCCLKPPQTILYAGRQIIV